MPADDSDAVCPYPGLRPYLPEQHHLFGREEMTERLLARVAGTRPGKPLVLIGDSGVGKSSLLSVAAHRAGLGRCAWCPHQERDRSGGSPMRGRRRWAARSPRSYAIWSGAVPPARAPGRAAGRLPGSVLVVDQLEQYLTHGAGEGERGRFAAAPAAADGPRVVLALRADCHGDVLGDPHLAPFAEHDHFVVPDMNDDEIEAAAVEPARCAGLEWETGVPRILLREVNEERRGGRTGDAAALP
ncbi:ATP-binding protein [Streptomyces sp. NPDC045251]|uniref:ATP-binding protein n=1 Tax=unclassified Streptomyces TaxID=2593676 RepID=UPI00340F0B23